jgi:6,7-dimethyl-8-ribityllumazine synthase
MSTNSQPALDGSGLRVAVLASRFNSVVTERLMAGALDAFRQHGVAEDALTVSTVPGAFELPMAAAAMVGTARFDAIACLGAIVRGETPHFDVIAHAVVLELARLSAVHRIPIALGVLTTNTLEQALERAGGMHGNKGYDAALVAIEMANLARRFPPVQR